MTLWSGRVAGELAPEVWDFLRADDAELLPYDIAGTLLHAERLHAAGLLDDAELAEVGRKIHAGRSRNDQVAAAVRLYVQDGCFEADAAIARFAAAILERA